MPRFSDILTKSSETVERPALPPKGTYVWAITGVPKPREMKGFEAVDFPVQAIRAGEDVDEDELKSWGDLKKNKITARLSFMFNTEDENAFEQTEFYMTEFLTQHLGQEHASLKELLNGAVNKQFVSTLSYRADKEDPERLYTQLGRTAPVS